MEIFPIACESLGTRSFAHFVKTENITILIDPSVSLAPVRFKLLPHPLEVAVAWKSRQTLLKLIEHSDVIIQTHYHGDHFTLGERRIYEFSNRNVFNQTYTTKTHILAKDPEKNLNYNQQKRAKWLWNKQGLHIDIADGMDFKFEQTKIKFSQAVPHGYDTQRGSVVETYIEDSESSYLYTSDVSGPASKNALLFVLENNPDVVVLDGPSSYHPNVSREEIVLAYENLSILAEQLPKIYIDHHFLRTLDWKEILKERIGKVLPAFSELRQQEPLLLEARRKGLYQQISFPKDFHSKFQYDGYSTEYFDQLLKQQNLESYWNNILDYINNEN